MSTLNDNDLMLIERNGVQYKVESQYVNAGPDGTITSPVEVLTPIDGDGLIVGTQDGVITSAITAVDGDTITFASDVSSSLESPVSMVDANGDLIALTTSAVSSTATVPGVDVSKSKYNFHWSNSTTINTGLSGNRMVWFKNYGAGYGIISDSVNFDGQYIPTGGDTISAQSNGITFNADSITSAGLMGASGTDHAFLFELVEAAEVFDIVNYTGDGSSSHVIPHNLGVEPGMIIIKSHDDNSEWVVWHKDVNAANALALNSALKPHFHTAKVTAVSSENFTVNDVWAANKSASNFVAYVFAADTAGKVKCGTYTGNNSDNTINVGFEPGFILVKNINSNYHWFASTEELMEWSTGGYWEPSSDNAATVNTSYRVNQVSNGFKLTGSSSATNGNGENYIYLAIANEIASETTTQLTFQDNTNLDQLTSGMTVTSDGPGQPVDLFSSQAYTGTSTSQTVNTGVNLLDSGGLFWLKNRNSNGAHWLYDSERGSSSHLRLTTDEASNYGDSYNIDFTNDGVQIGSNGSINWSGNTYVGWSFAEKPGFFDVVTYTGNGGSTANEQQISHNLGSKPGMIFVKRTDASGWNWSVYTDQIDGSYDYAYLNTDGSFSSSSNNVFTDSVFNVGGVINTSGATYVAYLFADNPSNGIKCGSYQGTDYSGTVQVDCGFEPQWVMIKSTTSSDRWRIYWSTSSNPGTTSLAANVNSAEDGGGGVPHISFTSSGFTVENSSGYSPNWADTFVFMAIGSPTGIGTPPTAELTADADPSTNTAIVNASSWPTGDTVTGPTVTATASSFNTGSYSTPGFSATTYTGNGGGGSISTGIDLSTKGLIWFKGIGGSGFQTNQHSHFLFDSERNNYGDYLNSAEHDRGMSFADYGWEPQPAADGTISNLQANVGASNVDYVAWAFRAMPGFFDVVTYDGDPNTAYVPQNISHDLGTAPGMMIIKNYSPYSGVDWIVYHKELGATQFLYLNYEQQATAATNVFNDTEPTDSEFTVGAFSAGTNNNGSSYVAYLFADNPSQGIKCGSYSGNDGTQTIDCGFGSDKAAFIMVKCSSHSSPSGWIMCDTSRPDGSDQTLHDIYANLKVSQLNNGRIGSVAGGFTLNDGNNDVNRAGRTYIYMAISETSGSFGDLASNQIKLDSVTGTFQVGANVKGADYIYEISSQSSAITAVDGNLLTFTNQDGLVEMTAPVSTDTGTATGFNFGSYTLPTFATTIYTGTKPSPQTIDNGLDLAGEGGLVWIKQRNGQRDHHLFDTERGATKYLNSRHADIERTNVETLTSFTSSGFTLGTDTQVNHQENFVSWAFRKAAGFFDVVTYQGSGSNNTAIPHSLGSAPGMIIIKSINSGWDWNVLHRSLGGFDLPENGKGTHPIMYLHTSYGVQTANDAWTDKYPDANNIYVNSANLNLSGVEYVAYLFADNPSNGIKCGRYTGTGGPQTIDTGFEPQWVMVKQITDDYRDWTIVDNARGTGSGNAAKQLRPNKIDGESGTNLGFVSNGFELYDASSEVNGVGGSGAYEYIYVAISANAGETVELETNQASLQGITGTFSVGQTVTGSAQVADHPLTSEIEFKSVNGASGTGEFNGTDCTLNARIWTLETASNINGPWTVVDTYIDSDANASQDGATPWTTGTPTLQPNTIYRVKVKYQTADSAPVESTYHTFKTGAS